MRRALLIPWLLGCEAPPITVAPPGDAPRTLLIESWEVSLALASDQGHKERLANVIDAVSRDEGVDVLCLHSVLADAEREAIVAAAKGVFPAVGYVRTDRSTRIDDPRDLTGVARTPPTTPACTEPADLDAARSIASCFESCVGVDGEIDERCALEKCAAAPQPPTPRCALCVRNAVLFGKPKDVVSTCRDAPNGELAGDGRLAALILSRHPLADVRATVFPSTMLRHGAITATASVRDRPVTVVCTFAEATPIEPYAGVFGAPYPPFGGMMETWLAELRVAELVRTLPPDRTTLILGGSFSQWSINRRSRAVQNHDWDIFATNFEPLVRPGDVCTFCATNPLLKSIYPEIKVDGVASLLFASGRLPTVESVSIGRTDARYSVRGKASPASPVHSLRATITLP